mgnify:CR=1 FL=1
MHETGINADTALVPVDIFRQFTCSLGKFSFSDSKYDAREIECAVLCPKAGEAPQASWPGEIVLDKRAEGDDQFYDFDSKYMNSDASHVEVPASLPEETLNRVRETAKKAFIAVDGTGLSRVDTFVTADGEVMVNEINTMPGFTPISMYPKAWEATGVNYTDLITMLIEGVLR